MLAAADLEKLALELPERARADLAARLLKSLPGVLEDEDGGVAEALRRASDFDADPAFGLSLEEFRQKMESLR